MTETTKHTPGPWIIRNRTGRNPSIQGPRGEVIAHVIYQDGFGTLLSNTQLIAASPELYNALATIIKRGYALDASDHALAIDALHKAFCTQSTTGAHT